MKLPYHTTHCLQHLRDRVIPMFRAESEADAESLKTIIDCWGSAPKFVCPDNGLFFENRAYDRYLPYFRLPYKSVVLEYAGVLGTYGQDTRNVLSVSLLAIENTVDGVLGADCVAAYQSHVTKAWMIIPAVLFIPYGDPSGSTETYLHEGSTVTALFTGSAIKVWAMKNSLGHDMGAALRKAGEVLQRECMSLLQMSVAMSCSNVKQELAKAPKFINAKRKAKGELPLFEYHMLTVDGSSRDAHGEAQGGTHATPRQHLRRGHVRRYQSGLTIWINDMVVSRDGPGKIEKDYRVKKVLTKQPA